MIHGQHLVRSGVEAQAGDSSYTEDEKQPELNPPRWFKLSGTYGSGGQFSSQIVMADLNGDGHPDLLVANVCASDDNCNQGTPTNHATVGVLLGNGDGTFQTTIPYDSGGFFARSLAVGDVNRDGKLDLLVSICSDANCATVSVLLGKGDGSFQPPLFSAGGLNGSPMTIADVNGDGKPDLLMASAGTTIGVMRGNGDGTFKPALSYSSGGENPLSIAVADLNGDGKPDLVVGNQCPISDNGFCPNSVVGVMLNNGHGAFPTVVSYSSGGSGIFSTSTADLNGDGKADVVVSNNCGNFNQCARGNVGVLTGNGDGTFQPAQDYSSGGNWAVDGAAADVNADNKIDLLALDECSPCTNGKLGVLLGNGDGTFQAAALYATGGYRATSMAVGDVNGDGKPDVAVANFCVSKTACGTGTVGILLAVRQRTVTQVKTSGSPSVVGQPVTFTAIVLAHAATVPDGEIVTFFDGTKEIGTGATAGGMAMFTTSSLTAKTHTIRATYPGDAVYKPSTGIVKQVVEP